MRKKNLALLFSSILIGLIIIEVFLRLTGVKPGWVNKFEDFTKVDTLILYKNFTTDEAGIYKFSPWVTDSLLKYFDCETRSIINPNVKRSLYESDRIFYLYESFCKQTIKPRFSLYWWMLERQNQETDSNCLLNTHIRISRNEAPSDSTWRSAVEEYFMRPFNHEGFRGIEFKNHQTKRLKVLIIGDSFVYGMDAHPFQNSFVDILLSRGYMVYAAGIPGTDPPQYAAIAKKYIPLIRPDVVISCFYTGNDFMKYIREPNNHQPPEHITNAGLYNSAPYGDYLTADSAYRFYLSLSTFPEDNRHLFDKICSYSAIGTLIWNTCLSKGLVTHPCQDYFHKQSEVPMDTIYARTKIYTDRMKNICTENQVPLINAVIPEVNPLRFDTSVLGRLFDRHYSLPTDFDDSKDYFKGGIHLNNVGSIKYADFLDGLLQPYAEKKKSMKEDLK